MYIRRGRSIADVTFWIIVYTCKHRLSFNSIFVVIHSHNSYCFLWWRTTHGELSHKPPASLTSTITSEFSELRVITVWLADWSVQRSRIMFVMISQQYNITSVSNLQVGVVKAILINWFCLYVNKWRPNYCLHWCNGIAAGIACLTRIHNAQIVLKLTILLLIIMINLWTQQKCSMHIF